MSSSNSENDHNSNVVDAAAVANAVAVSTDVNATSAATASSLSASPSKKTAKKTRSKGKRPATKRSMKSKNSNKTLKKEEASSIEFYVLVYEMALDTAEDEITTLLERAAARGLEAAGAPNYLESLDWTALLRLLPFVVEYVDTFKNLGGSEKEKKAIALVVAVAKAANHEHLVDEHALETLRLMITFGIDVSHGKFEINAKTKRNALRAVVHGVTWAVTHCKCGGGGDDDDDDSAASAAVGAPSGSTSTTTTTTTTTTSGN